MRPAGGTRLAAAARLGALVAVAAVAAACTPMQGRPAAPADPATSLAARAHAICSCLRAGRDLPRRRFTTDRCSVAPDGNWADCCVDHDISYWCGGSAGDRREADRRLASCVEGHGHSPRFAAFVRRVVRAGGGPFSPFPWRWGYGWKTLRGYDERAGAGDADSCFAAEGSASR